LRAVRADSIHLLVSETTSDHLAWEAEWRTRAGVATLLAALFTLAGAIGSIIVRNAAPKPGWLESFERLPQPGPVGNQQSLRVELYQYVDDHALGLLANALVSALGFLAAGVGLAYLARATRARRAEYPRFALYLPHVGAGLMALQILLVGLGTVAAARTFLDGPQTIEAAKDLNQTGLLVAGSLTQLLGVLAYGSAFVFVGLNAMRAGLLTRFMGVLAIAVGVFSVLQFGAPGLLLQVFWLAALGVLILGQWPSGVPPAWRTGRAEPWPSAQEARDARRTETERRRGRGQAPEPEVEEPVTVPSGREHPSSKKRKRKRRH
jgi:hypothetical protein